MKAKRFWGTSTSAAAYIVYAATTSWIPHAAYAQSADTSAASASSATSASTTATTTTVDDQTVAKFAAAYNEVSAIQTQATDELKTTSDPQKVEELKKNAEARALQAVQSKGLKAEEFNTIAQQMVSDEALRTRVASKLTQQRSGGG